MGASAGNDPAGIQRRQIDVHLNDFDFDRNINMLNEMFS